MEQDRKECGSMTKHYMQLISKKIHQSSKRDNRREQRLSNRLQTSLRHIRNRRRACCSASTLAFNSETFGPLATFGALGSSGTDTDSWDFFVISSNNTDKAASMRQSKNKYLSSVDGLPN